MPPISRRIGFIGAGNMSQAIVAGMLDAGVIKPDQIIASAPSDNNLSFWKNKGISTTKINSDVVQKSDVVVFAMKPQYLDDAIKSLDKISLLPTNKLFLSILAGISIEQINEKLCFHFNYTDSPFPWRIARVIPNTPIMVGAGASAYSVSKTVTQDDIELVRAIFSSGGICEMVPEKLMNAVGALSGSGPAYIYLVIEAMCDGAVKMGLSRALATQLACQTVIGAGKMVHGTGRHPGQLKDEVCSPGGTTITGVHALEKAGVRAAFISAVEAATNRSFELGSNK